MNFEDKISKYQNLTFNKANKTFFENKINFELETKSLGMVDFKSGLFTNLALLLSDQNPFDINVATFSDQNKTSVLNRKEFSGSIFSQVEEVVDFINQQSFKILKEKNCKVSDYPEDSIKDAVINAIIHRNYNFNGSILIKINQEEIEITSLGGLADGIELEDLKKEISIQRNPKLVHIFSQLGLIQANGTGLNGIFSEYSKMEIEPKINITDNVFQIILPNRNAKNKLNTNTIRLTENRIKVLKLLLKTSSKAVLRDKSNLSSSTFYKVFNYLKDNNLIIESRNNHKKTIKLSDKGKQFLIT